MNDKSTAVLPLDVGLNLPLSATTRNGVVFDPRLNKWAYRDGSKAMSLNFSSIIDPALTNLNQAAYLTGSC